RITRVAICCPPAIPATLMTLPLRSLTAFTSGRTTRAQNGFTVVTNNIGTGKDQFDVQILFLEEPPLQGDCHGNVENTRALKRNGDFVQGEDGRTLELRLEKRPQNEEKTT